MLPDLEQPFEINPQNAESLLRQIFLQVSTTSDSTLFQRKLDEINAYSTTKRSKSFSIFIRNILQIADNYSISVEGIPYDHPSIARVKTNLSTIVGLFPGNLLAHSKVVQILEQDPKHKAHDIAQVRQIGNQFLQGFENVPFFQLEGRYAGLNTTLAEPVRDEIDFVEVLTSETDNFSSLDNLLFFMANFYDESTWLTMRDLHAELTAKQRTPKDIHSQIAKDLIEQCEEYKRRLESDYERFSSGLLAEDRILLVRHYKQGYKAQVVGLEGLIADTKTLRQIVDDVDDQFRDIIFKQGKYYGAADAASLRTIVYDCNAALKAVKKMQYGAQIVDTVSKFRSLTDITTAAQELAKRMSSPSSDAIHFVSNLIISNQELRPEDVGAAVEWYDRRGKHISDQEARAKYFSIARPYQTEFNLFESFWRRAGTFDTPGLAERLDYCLGSSASGLQLPEKEALLLKRNTLKVRLGRSHYEQLIDSVIDPVQLTTLLSSEECAELQKFLEPFDKLGDLPIHEHEVTVVSKNETYIIDINLPSGKLLTSFVKIYKNPKDYEFEQAIIAGLIEAGINTRPLGPHTQLGDLSVSMFSFINGRNLYDVLHDAPTQEQRAHYFEAAIKDLVAIQKAGAEFCERNAFDLKQLSRDHDFFTRYIQCHMTEGHIPTTVVEAVYANISQLIDYLVAETRKDPSYYKDSNPRNVMVAIEEASHIDFEYQDITLGEFDLAKLLRNGLEYTEWDDSYDYSATTTDSAGFIEKRAAAKQYLASRRYLNQDEEEHFLEVFNQEKGRSLDVEAHKRYDMASLYVHLYYVGWFAMKSNEATSHYALNIVNNRKKYHLLEAKCLVDDILYDRQYNLNHQFRTELTELRKSLDLIPREITRIAA